MTRQKGFTIIEVLVALTLSLLLILGVSQIFVGNRETYGVQTGMGVLQENARFAVAALRRDFSMAGYPADLGIVPFDPNLTRDSGNTDPDQVAVVYLSDRNCAGTVVPSVRETRRYHVESVDGKFGLMCNDTIIVDGVENMQIQYGIDENADERELPDSWVTADKVTNWERVAGVRFALLLNSVEPVSAVADTAKFNLLDAPEIAPVGDFLRRRAYFATVLLRNRTDH